MQKLIDSSILFRNIVDLTSLDYVDVAEYAWLPQTNSSSLRCYLSWANISKEKS